MPDFNLSQTLFNAAQGFLNLGYNPIPLHADPDRAKIAAVAWKDFQHSQPTPEQLRSWFLDSQVTGMGIVTGEISQLIILDFDDPALFTVFQEQYPDLTATATVATRRGCHLWFRLEAGKHLATRKGQGVDLLGEGSYAVAPPTTIGDHRYHFTNELPPRTLSDNDQKRIAAFLDTLAPNTPQYPVERENESLSCEFTGTIETATQPPTRVLTQSDLISRYRLRAGKGSRNQALFDLSCLARDHGWSSERVENTLIEAHIHQEPAGHHRPESHRHRRREAQATIASAFKRPPRPLPELDGEIGQLPNTVREALCQMGQTATVRVIETLRLAGIAPGQGFTYGFALDALSGVVGQWSLRKALAAITEEGVQFIESTPSPEPPTPNDATADLSLPHRQPLMLNGRAEKPTKNSRGRPATVYIMPSNADLCLKLGVEMAQSDPLTLEDLVSAKQTRLGMHRELIKRRPGWYPRRWLAVRLGVCVRTIDTYTHESGIRSHACYEEKCIFWSNLGDLPVGFQPDGCFLEDESGQRYPPKREIAVRLLSQKKTLVYKQQTVSYYWYDDPQAEWTGQGALSVPVAAPVTTPPLPVKGGQQPSAVLNTVNATPSLPRSVPSATAHSQPALWPEAPVQREYTPVGVEQVSARQQQDCADNLYQTLRRISAADQRLSRANAEKLVATYGVAAIDAATRRLLALHKRGRITSPVGFLIVQAKNEWRILNDATNPGDPAPRFHGVRAGG